ncbi:MAG: LUD domain-containing protein [Gammaproteobacteria bacterium]|nr:LUD domain-containing protein [Gammaproteobacteria bacterium]
MSTARDAILGRLRAVPTPEAAEARDFAVIEAKQWNADERVARLAELMRKVNTEVHESDDAAWPGLLAELCVAKGVERLCLAPDTPVGRAAGPALAAAGVTTVAYDRDVEAWKEELFFEIDAGLTSVAGGIAETGSLFVVPTAQEPRLLSLAPPVHFAVLSRASIGNTLLEVLRAQGFGDTLPTNVLLISGPSKTADIEQTLVYGVHGPKQLIVLLTD